MEKNDVKIKLEKIRTEEDFINAPKFNNSLNKLLAKTDNPLENNAIGRVLLLSAEEVEENYKESVEAIKKEIKEDAE